MSHFGKSKFDFTRHCERVKRTKQSKNINDRISSRFYGVTRNNKILENLKLSRSSDENSGKK